MSDEERGVQVLEPHPNGTDAQGGSAAAPDVTVVTLPGAEVASVAVPASAPAEPGATEKPARGQRGRRWIIPAGIASAGLIISGALGALLVSTTGQRDAARHQLAATQTVLAGVRHQLDSAQSEIAARKVTETYTTIWVSDGGQLLTDYETLLACNAYSDCRTIAQQALSDLQAFQSARAGANVPAALQSADDMLRDSLSAAIAAMQLTISGMDNNDVNKLTDGLTKVDQAMLSIGKAESALAKSLV